MANLISNSNDLIASRLSTGLNTYRAGQVGFGSTDENDPITGVGGGGVGLSNILGESPIRVTTSANEVSISVLRANSQTFGVTRIATTEDLAQGTSGSVSVNPSLLKTALDSKASIAYVDSAVSNRVTTTQFNTALNLKVNTSDLDTILDTRLSSTVQFSSGNNVRIGTGGGRSGTQGTNQLVLFNGTPPVGTLSGGVSLYSSAGELYAMDAGGNSTILTNPPAPEVIFPDYTVNSIEDLQTADTTITVFVKQYYADYSAEPDLALLSQTERRGGGLFYWNPNIPKSRHDGGTFISPTVPYNGTRAGLVNYLGKVGETDPSGSGVWVRYYVGTLKAEYFGCVSNGIADDQPSIQKALDVARTNNNIPNVGSGNTSNTRVVEIVGTCRVKRYLEVPYGITLYGHGQTQAYPNQDAGYANDYNWTGGPTIYVDKDCVLFTGRANKSDNSVIMLYGDSSKLEGVVVDGYELEYGSWYPGFSCLGPTGVGSSNNFQGYLKVIDPNDPRQAGNLRILTEQVPAFQLGDSWHPGFQLEATGGNKTGVGSGTSTYTQVSPSNPYQWGIVSGTMPSGISISSSGWVTCSNPTTPGKTFIKIYVADADGTYKEKDLIFEVKGKYINPENGGLPRATVEVPYNFQCELVNANDPQGHYWWIVGGPEGLTINQNTGLISGTPTTTSYGKYNLKVVITTNDDVNNLDSNTILDSIEYDFSVENDSFPRLYNKQLPEAFKDTPYLAYIYVYGGKAPYTWQIDPTGVLTGYENTVPGYPTSVSPAPGLTLSVAADGVRGVVSGTPTTSGTFNFKVVITDSTGKEYKDFIFINGVNAPAKTQLKMSSNWNLPVAVKGQPYSYQLEATIPGSTFRTKNNPFPTGLSMSSSGLISGTPTGGRIANGVSCAWGSKISTVNIRNFRNGAGLLYDGPTNVHVVENFFINVCDVGIASDNIYDSRFDKFYIFGCRIGMALSGGSAACTFINGRIEYIYEYGVTGNFANENLWSSVFWDTCGYAAITATSCAYWVLTGCLFYRSGRRIPPRGKHYSPDSPTKLSTHINLEDCTGFDITGNTFIRGSETEGGSAYLKKYESNGRRDWVRPNVCLTVENTTKTVVTGNQMAGCTGRSIVSEVVPFESNYNDLIVKDNIVQYKNGFSTLKPNSKIVDNILYNANKYNFLPEGDQDNVDPYYTNTSLLLHGHEITDRSYRAYAISNTNVTINNSVYLLGTGSLSFDGTTSLLAIQELNNGVSTGGFYFGFNSFTIELQVYPLRNNVPQTLIDFGTTNESTTFALALDANGKLVLAKNRTTSGQTTDYISSVQIPTNTWTRIIVCKTGGSNGDVRIYINNNLDATLGTEFDNRFIISGYARPLIGRGGFTGATDYFQGYMQEIRVTKDISRYSTATSIPAQIIPYGDVNYGSVPVDTLIYSPKSTARESFWADRSYSVSLGATSSIQKYLKIVRRGKSDVISDLRAGDGSSWAGEKNPGSYLYNITKEAEVGATTYTYQQCEFRLWIARFGNVKEFDLIRGKRLNLVFYAKSKNRNKVTIFTQFYAGTSDNNYKVDGGYFSEFFLPPFWRKYYFEIDVPDYDLTRVNPLSCNAYIKFIMDDKSVNYDWDLGGLMIYPADGTFGFRPFVE